MKHVVGFSGGIDSQAVARWVLNRFPKEDVILLNSNAGGNESPVTVKFIEDYSAAVHPVMIVEAIHADMWETPGYAEKKGLDSNAPLSFLDMIKIKGRPPSRKAQFCTEKLKLRPAMRWIKANIHGEYVRYSGLRRQESDARKHTPYSEHDDWFECTVFHPIFDWTKEMCFDYVKHHGEEFNPLYKLGFNRVGCAPCINSGRDDIRNWNQRFPDMIDKIRSWEKESGRTFFAPMVPGKDINWIDEVVEWANCERGGKQYSLEVMHPPAVCESKYGLCE